MKIITKDAVYVQKGDILFLNDNEISMPSSLFYEAFNQDVVFLNENEYFDFIKLDKEYIDYFKKTTFIIDLFEINKLTEKQIVILAKKTLEEYNKLKKEYDNMEPHEKYNNRKLKQKLITLDYKFDSIGYILQFIRGNVKIYVPTEALNNTKQEKKKNIFSLKRKK